MTWRFRPVVATAVALLAWATVAPAAGHPSDRDRARTAAQAGGTPLLDVPYLPQTDDLCGGAALAMTLRYWGERQVYPEDFAPLVDRSASGIRTDVLAAEAGRRGWQSFPLAAAASTSGAWVREHIERGRPIIALVEVRPNRFHYVVVVAWTDTQVIAHDPARAPFRVMSLAEFDRAWAAAGRWALLVLPRTDRPPAPAAPVELPTDGASRDADACGALVREMVGLARAGDLDGADAGLLAAIDLCPGSAAALRGIAGVRFLQSRWDEAGTIAERATVLDPGDVQGWDLLATSRFLADRPEAALEAWNAIGRPAVDLVRIEGARRTRHAVVAALVGLPSKIVLTPANLDRAARRLNELPGAAATRMRYRPVGGGLAEVEAIVVERPTVPLGVVPVVALAARTWLRREFSLDVATPTGSGELWTVAWRWWEARPRWGVALAVPAVAWLPGVTTAEGSWERQSYATPGAPGAGPSAIRSDERRRAALHVGEWATSRLRWQTGAALDRWAHDSHLSVDATVDLRLAADRLAIRADGAGWVPIGSGRGRFARGGVTTAWRSTRKHETPAWTIRAGLDAASAAAPFDLWPGAGTGQAREPLLRAHPLLDAGVVSGPAFGRRLLHGTIEYQHPLSATRAGALRLAAFADAARAWGRVANDGRAALHVDVGAGIRLALPASAGSIRADVAVGLRDGRVTFSSGWQTPWPGR